MKRVLKSELDRDMVISGIKRLDITKSYTVEITQKKRIRTISQNRLYRLWLVCISFETGTDADVLHEIFKEKFLEPEIIELFDVKTKRYTTTNLNTIQFKNYLDKIQIFVLTELTISLPTPEDLLWDEFVNFYQDKL